MSAPNNMSTDHSRAVLAGAHTDGRGVTKPEGSRADRATSFEVEHFAVPTGREEEWRFTPLKPLAPMFSDVAGATDAVEVNVEDAAGVEIGTLAPGQGVRGTVLVPADRPAAIASARSEQATHIYIPAGVELDRPLHVRVRGLDTAKVAHAHTVLEVGAQAKAIVIFDHTGAAHYNANVEIAVGEAAEVTVVSLQRWDEGAVHTGEQKAVVAKDAKLKHVVVSLGGSLVRLNANVGYAGEGAEANLLGVYFADSGQHLEHRSFVDHSTPNCVSRVTYKGALQGESARTVWVGDVLIGADAHGTDSYESNRNLVLTEGARADSIPNLEIETGQIEGAGHASATGRFADDHLFYLQSRGIDEATARRLVVRGFFAEVVAEIGVTEVEEIVMAAIEAELEMAAQSGAQV